MTINTILSMKIGSFRYFIIKCCSVVSDWRGVIINLENYLAPTSGRPLSKPMMVQFSDTCVPLQGEISLNHIIPIARKMCWWYTRYGISPNATEFTWIKLIFRQCILDIQDVWSLETIAWPLSPFFPRKYSRGKCNLYLMFIYSFICFHSFINFSEFI